MSEEEVPSPKKREVLRLPPDVSVVWRVNPLLPLPLTKISSAYTLAFPVPPVAITNLWFESILTAWVPPVPNEIVSAAKPIWVLVSPKWNIDLAIPTSFPSNVKFALSVKVLSLSTYTTLPAVSVWSLIPLLAVINPTESILVTSS